MGTNTDSKAAAVTWARQEAKRTERTHYAFDWKADGRWAISAGLHVPAERGYVVAYPSRATVEVLPL